MGKLHVIAVNQTPARWVRRYLHGRPHLVGPATLIVPGVLNGSKGALLYRPEDIKRAVRAWNHMPITLGHPRDETGEYTSAREPSILERYQLGTVLNARFDDRLRAEAWLDEEWTRNKAPEILTAIEDNRPVELSTGLGTNDKAVSGTWNHTTGIVQPYTHVALDHEPDHLAILIGQPGACSLAHGCGLGVNKKTCPECDGKDEDCDCDPEKKEMVAAYREPLTLSAFCPTGDGGGQDNSCPPGEGTGVLGAGKSGPSGEKQAEKAVGESKQLDISWMKKGAVAVIRTANKLPLYDTHMEPVKPGTKVWILEEPKRGNNVGPKGQRIVHVKARTGDGRTIQVFGHELAQNAFCPTGSGGGQDNSCPPAGAGKGAGPKVKGGGKKAAGKKPKESVASRGATLAARYQSEALGLKALTAQRTKAEAGKRKIDKRMAPILRRDEAEAQARFKVVQSEVRSFEKKHRTQVRKAWERHEGKKWHYPDPDEDRPVKGKARRALNAVFGLVVNAFHPAGVTGNSLTVNYVKEEDGKFCVYSEDGKKLGEHATRAEAEAQLKAIEANKHANNQDQESDMATRKENVAFLVANCDCWKGKAELLANEQLVDDRMLNQMVSDARLKIGAGTVINALQKDFQVPTALALNELPAFLKSKMGKDDEEEEDEEEEDEEEELLATNRRRKGKTVNFDNLTDEQLDQLSVKMYGHPRAVVKTTINAHLSGDQREKTQLINQLVANAADDRSRKAAVAIYSELPVEKLRSLVATAPHVRNAWRGEPEADPGLNLGSFTGNFDQNLGVPDMSANDDATLVYDDPGLPKAVRNRATDSTKVAA